MEYKEEPDLTGYLMLLAILLPFAGVMVALVAFYKYKPEQFKKFADKLRQKRDIKITSQVSPSKIKKIQPKATVPAKPKREAKQVIGTKTQEFIEKREVIKESKVLEKPIKVTPTTETPKKAPEAVPKKAIKAEPKEKLTTEKVLDETELQDKFKAETGKNAIWRGQETKAYTEWKQKRSNN